MRTGGIVPDRLAGQNAGMSARDDYSDNDLPPSQRWAGILTGLGLVCLGVSIIAWCRPASRLAAIPDGTGGLMVSDKPIPDADD